jgi:hypothetical protein
MFRLASSERQCSRPREPRDTSLDTPELVPLELIWGRSLVTRGCLISFIIFVHGHRGPHVTGLKPHLIFRDLAMIMQSLSFGRYVIRCQRLGAMGLAIGEFRTRASRRPRPSYGSRAGTELVTRGADAAVRFDRHSRFTVTIRLNEGKRDYCGNEWGGRTRRLRREMKESTR